LVSSYRQSKDEDHSDLIKMAHPEFQSLGAIANPLDLGLIASIRSYSSQSAKLGGGTIR
jgi:hypothetical protein